MGSNFATELASGDLFPTLDLESAIAMHLQGNHYPPVPVSMVQPCIDAIDAYNSDEPEKNIELPDGITWKGKTYAPAYAIIEGHHLQAWCSFDDYLDDEEYYN